MDPPELPNDVQQAATLPSSIIVSYYLEYRDYHCKYSLNIFWNYIWSLFCLFELLIKWKKLLFSLNLTKNTLESSLNNPSLPWSILKMVMELFQLSLWPSQFVLKVQDKCLTLSCHWSKALPMVLFHCFPELTLPWKGKGCLFTSLLLPVSKYFASCHGSSTRFSLFKLKHMPLSTFFWWRAYVLHAEMSFILPYLLLV